MVSGVMFSWDSCVYEHESLCVYMCFTFSSTIFLVFLFVLYHFVCFYLSIFLIIYKFYYYLDTCLPFNERERTGVNLDGEM